MQNTFRTKLVLHKPLYFYILLFCLFAGGIFFRIWWVINIPTEQRYDFATYHAIAANIAEGRGHTLDGLPVAWQGSGYSYVLGLFYALTGVSETGGKYLNIFFSVLTLVNCYFIYTRFFKKNAHILIALAITALLPSLAAYNNVLGTETFFLLLMSLMLLIQLYLPYRKFRYPLLGALCGVCALTKPFMLAYPVILTVIDWVENRSIRQGLTFFSVCMLACILVVAPWTYRNYHLFGRLVTVSYNSGYVLYINNNNSNTTGSWMDLSTVEGSDAVKSEIIANLSKYPGVKQAHDLEPLLTQEAKSWIWNHPIEFCKLGILRLYATFFSGANDIGQWTMNGLTREYTATYGWDDTAYARNMNLIQSFFDMTVYLLSGASFLFLFAFVKRYALNCLPHKKDKSVPHSLKLPLPENIIFLNLAFFIVINFVYEGQARYIFPVLIFMIAAMVLVLTRVTQAEHTST